MKLIKKVSNAHLFLSLIFIVSISCSSITAKPLNQEPYIYDAYLDILKLKLESGRDKLDRIIPTHSQLGHYHYVKSLADIIEIMITEDEDLFKKYSDNEDENLKGVREMDDSDPHKRFYSSEIRIHWAVVKILFEDEVKAGWSLKTAYSDIEKNIEEFPDFEPNYKSFGAMHVLFASVPESYHWVLKFIGVKANNILGWEELGTIKPNSPYWIETNMVRSLIALNIINDPEKTMRILNDLLKVQKDNLIVNYLYHFALIKYARSELALVGLKKLAFPGKSYFPITKIYYKIGEIYIQKQEYTLARFYYAKFLNLHTGANYIKDTWFKIFLTFWLENNEKMAEIHWSKAQKSGRSYVPADKNADEILNRDNYPNKSIIKARLATDGGYFLLATHSLDEIKQGSLANKKEECEYFYRYGRLYDKEGKKDDAIFYYLNTIKKAGKENWYYGPSASLNIGYIYESNDDYEKAQYFYNKAISYKKHKYKSGIDGNAQAALALLKIKSPELFEE